MHILVRLCKGKSVLLLQVPGTGTQVLGTAGPFFYSSIVSFWIARAGPKEGEYHNLGNTGTPEMFQCSPILGRSSIWYLKYLFRIYLYFPL